jgi:hypothetical protein
MAEVVPSAAPRITEAAVNRTRGLLAEAASLGALRAAVVRPHQRPHLAAVAVVVAHLTGAAVMGRTTER